MSQAGLWDKLQRTSLLHSKVIKILEGKSNHKNIMIEWNWYFRNLITKDCISFMYNYFPLGLDCWIDIKMQVFFLFWTHIKSNTMEPNFVTAFSAWALKGPPPHCQAFNSHHH